MPVLIRRARSADCPGIARVHAGSWRTAYRELLPPSYLATLTVRGLTDTWHRRLLSRVPGETIWVAADLAATGDVIGFCTGGPMREGSGFHGLAAEIGFLYVHPMHLGAGVGGALLERALDALERAGYRWVVVGVLEKNERARRFYDAHGLRFGGSRWINRRFGVAVVLHEKALNPVADFAALRPKAAR